jgi:hypothetical protein
MNKQIFTITFAIFLILGLTGFASAYGYFIACFDKGEVIHYCNNYKPAYTCDNKNGCQKCMIEYRAADNCYIHGSNINECNELEPICSNIQQQNTSFDVKPPVITINSPVKDNLYTKTSVLVNISLDEKASIYYKDLLKTGDWKKLCDECISYSSARLFSEGQNNIIFRAVDLAGNEANKTINFFIDSKKPSISKTDPRSGFTNGMFELEFIETNPKQIALGYGNASMYKQEVFNSNDISKNCYLSKTKYYCNFDIRSKIKTFEGQQINYSFKVIDIANNFYEKAVKKIIVYTTDPKVNLFNFTISKKTVSFYANVSEKNFDEIGYNEIVNGKNKYTVLCSTLKNGICQVKKTFSTGAHTLGIQVIDKAGNSIAFSRDFTIY